MLASVEEMKSVTQVLEGIVGLIESGQLDAAKARIEDALKKIKASTEPTAKFFEAAPALPRILTPERKEDLLEGVRKASKNDNLLDLLSGLELVSKRVCGAGQVVVELAGQEYRRLAPECKVLGELVWLLVQLHDSGGEPIFREGLIQKAAKGE